MSADPLDRELVEHFDWLATHGERGVVLDGSRRVEHEVPVPSGSGI
jgi:hypothetical protein